VPLTCASWIGLVRPHLAELLVGRPAFDRLLALARHLPAHGLNVIETRLASRSTGTADLSLRLTAPGQAADLAPRLLPPHLRTFLASGWQELGHPVPVAAVWLELDLGRAPQGLPKPLTCARLHGSWDAQWLVDKLLPALHGRPLTASQKHWLHRGLAELPAAARVLYAFSLAARPGNAVRLEICGLEPAAMIAYLDRWAPATAGRQIAEIAPLVEGCGRYHLSFDVEDGVSPRLGVECGFERLPHREPGWRRLLDRLVAAGLCDAAKRDAVLAWPGTDSPWTAVARWPPEAMGLGGYCVRCLSHVKLVSTPGRPPEAKAYLIFEHLQRPAQADGAPTSRLSSSAST